MGQNQKPLSRREKMWNRAKDLTKQNYVAARQKGTML